MTTATSSSDRYEAARATLADFDARTAKLDSTVETTMERRLASALRALITPAPAEESIAQIADRVMNKHRSNSGDLNRVILDAISEGVHAGIQAAWESWEPETAPGLPSGTAEQLAAESEEAIEAIKRACGPHASGEAFEAYDRARDVLYRWIMFTKEAGE